MFGRKHWFAFSFTGNGAGERLGQAWASSYIGYPNKAITMGRILEAKRAAGVADDATLLAVSYLGKMTRRQFVAAPTPGGGDER